MALSGREREALIEATTTAHRAARADGPLATHPAWHDLDEAAREEAFAATLAQRTLEAALDPRGLTTTAAAVLARIRAARGDVA